MATKLRGLKILVTGGAGFLGRHLLDNLIKKRGVSPEDIFVPHSQDFDLRRREDCEEVCRQKDLVIHLAAKVGGIGYNQEKPGELFYDNIIMGTQILEAAYRAGVKKMVILATICSYPKFTPLPFSENDLWSGYPEETNAPYGLAKRAFITGAQAYQNQHSFNVICLLPVNLYGPGDNFDPQRSHVVPALIRKVAEAKKLCQNYIEVWGTGRATREFLYVEDAAEGILLAAENYNKPDPVNLGSGKEISIKDLTETICRLMDFEGEIHWDSSKPDGQPRRMLDVSRAKKEFGFEAKTDFETGLKKTIDWYLTDNF